jgi:uncharacterized protein YqjF (DUF2071 family)
MRVVSGAWQKIIMANYVVDPAVLFPLLPSGTRLSMYNQQCFVTLAGFVFSRITVFGLKIPFHGAVPEINLRFYVIPKTGDASKKGVVFIRELIPKGIMGRAANLLYREHYRVEDVKHAWMSRNGIEMISYTWPHSNEMSVTVTGSTSSMVQTGSVEDYILHNFYGYSNKDKATRRYRVTHPHWRLRDISQQRLQVDFGSSFGDRFAFLQTIQPHSVYLTDGSDISIYRPVTI